MVNKSLNNLIKQVLISLMSVYLPLAQFELQQQNLFVISNLLCTHSKKHCYIYLKTTAFFVYSSIYYERFCNIKFF